MRLICNHVYENETIEKHYKLCTNKQRRDVKEMNSVKVEEIPVQIDASKLMEVMGDNFSKEEKIYIRLLIDYANTK